MRIGALTVTLYAPWVHSLKEKRMLVQSLLKKTRDRFNVSAAEVDAQDLHQTLVLGFVCAAGTTQLADSILDKVLGFIEANTEAQVTQIHREVF